MKYIILAIAVIVLGVKYIRRPTPQRLPLAITQGGNCASKKLCAIVYLTPWCPACHQITPVIIKALPGFENNPDHGIQVVMGMESKPGDNEARAKEIGPSVIIDSDQKISQTLNVTRYPTILVVDQKREIQFKDAEAYQWIAKH